MTTPDHDARPLAAIVPTVARRQWITRHARVDPRSEVPFTDQVEARIRGCLANGWTGWLPSEAELCEAHGVSRGTVRRALLRIERDGLISGRRGRGWFVRE